MSNTIKKAFQPIMALLEANAGKKVSQVLEDVKALCVAKQGGGGGARSFHKVGDTVVAAKCGYFNKWFLTSAVEFGAKASSASGLNTMCKAGVSAWTTQNNEYKKAREALLEQVASGEVAADEVQNMLKAIEAAKDERKDIPEGGYDTLEELLAANGMDTAEE